MVKNFNNYLYSFLIPSEESIYSGLGFYSTNSREESLTVYSSTGKEK